MAGRDVDMTNYDDEIKNVFHVVGPSQRKEVKRVLLSQSNTVAKHGGAAAGEARSNALAHQKLTGVHDAMCAHRQAHLVLDELADVSLLQFLLLAGVRLVLYSIISMEGTSDGQALSSIAQHSRCKSQDAGATRSSRLHLTIVHRVCFSALCVCVLLHAVLESQRLACTVFHSCILLNLDAE